MDVFPACGRLCVILVVSVLLHALPGRSGARTWYVPSEIEMIYEAVDSASYGDTVLVAPGTYYRERDKSIPVIGGDVWLWLKDGVTITSEEGPEATVLLDTGTGPVTYTVYGDSAVGVVLSGFMIEHGWPRAVGTSEVGRDAILVKCSDVVVENNVILGCSEGIVVQGGSPRHGTPIIRNNEVRGCDCGIASYLNNMLDTPLIEGNTVKFCDYGMCIGDSDPYIVGNIVAGNSEAGIFFQGWSQSLMHSNKIVGNGKYGVEDRTDYILQSPCLNCTFTRETANDVYGNGLYDVYFVEESGLGRFEARYNYWGNLCPQEFQFYGRVGVEVWVDSTHTVICINCEDCSHSTEAATWGAIKALFR